MSAQRFAEITGEKIVSMVAIDLWLYVATAEHIYRIRIADTGPSPSVSRYPGEIRPLSLQGPQGPQG